MTSLHAKITDFVASHKKFPTAVDLRRANKWLWTELTPNETNSWLSTVSASEHLNNPSDIAFRYWLYWLQAERLRVTNGNLVAILSHKYNYQIAALTLSRMKNGRRAPSSLELNIFFNLYLQSPSEIKQLKQEVIQNGNST